MAYDLSFSNDFFYNEGEYNITDKPENLENALYNMHINNKHVFNAMVKEVLGYKIHLLSYLPDNIIPELIDKAIEYNTCANLSSPVKVYINENYSVFVY